MYYIDIITKVSQDHERPTLIRIGGPKTQAVVSDYNNNFENEINLPDAAILDMQKAIQTVLDKHGVENLLLNSLQMDLDLD